MRRWFCHTTLFYAYFQEFGPGGYHVAMGFANPSIIRSRKPSVCAGTAAATPPNPCTQSFYGQVTTTRLSRTPVTFEQVRENKGNALFFGQFTSMTLEEFQDSMRLLTNDDHLVYGATLVASFGRAIRDDRLSSCTTAVAELTGRRPRSMRLVLEEHLDELRSAGASRSRSS